ncbi:MAG: PA14 domain-containing protein, partial [Gammaproteobacteria bacterium]
MTVFDDNTNCTRTVGPVVITDPLPTPFNVSALTPAICLGDPGTIRLANSEGASVIYEVYQDGNPTGITLPGVNGQLDFMIPAGNLTPTGVYSFTIEAVNGVCAPVFMNGAPTITVNPLPTAVTSGGGIICQGDVLPDVTFTFTGAAPFDFTYFDGTSSTNVIGHGTSTFTLVNAPVGTYSVTALTDANTCVATSLGTTVSVIENPLPTAVPSGGGTICQGDVLPDVTFTFTGTAPFDFTYFDGTTSTNVAGHPTTTFTLVNAPVGTYSVTALTDANTCVGTSFGGAVVVSENPRPTITLGANPTVCTGTASTTISYSATTDAPDQFRIDWDATAEAAGLVDVAPTALPAGMITIFNVPVNGGTYNGTLYVINSGTTCESIGDAISVTVQQDIATLSGDATVCGGTASTLTVNFTGPGPTWNFTYTDGSSNFNLVAGTNPFTFNVTPIISTTYTLVSVTGATCGAGLVNGSATITLSPIAGNPATFGNETWLGYVYDDSGSPAPPATNIDYNNTKYRGFINETEIASASAFSSYNTSTDAFNLNMTNSIPISGTNVCGSYLNDYSIRFRMTKTFAAGIYTFTLGSDDGVRLLVDGVSVLPAGAFATHAFTNYTSPPQCLTAGTHNLVIEYFERGGFSRIDFNYTSAPPPSVSTPVSVCVNSPAPTLTASSPGAIDFNWYTDAALTGPPIFSGANYVPASPELDMTIAGTTDFFVTAVYACGETPAAQVTVDVTNGATINLPPPPVQVCDVGGMVDLTTLVSAIPAGGAFNFSGTGVTVSPMFDPTLVTGITTISIDYTSGTCMASTTFDIDVVSNAMITVPATSTACESAGFLDLTTIASGSPAGGVFTFAGTGVTGTDFDPSGLSGPQSITVDYNIGGCVAATQMFDVDVVPNISFTPPSASTTMCPTDGPLDLSTLITATPSTGVFTFTGTGVTGSNFDPSGSAGTTEIISVDYNLNGCLANTTISVTVRAVGDPACGGPTGNCASVVITPVPSPAI